MMGMQLLCVIQFDQGKAFLAVQGQQQPGLAMALWSQDQVLLQGRDKAAPSCVLKRTQHCHHSGVAGTAAAVVGRRAMDTGRSAAPG